MKKIGLDSDSLIKLAKVTILETLAESVTCIISGQVYEETVFEGKKNLYDDAEIIEELVKRSKIKKIPVKNKEIQGIGKGESATYHLWKAKKVDVIISDNKKFLELIVQEKVPFAVTSHIIVALHKSKKISKDKAKQAILKLKNMISKEAYEDALKSLGG
ncbi:MAG: hypothetical protein QW331_01800 [Candidatus Woesearchaeota archaeon]